jgi:type I restriction enzyme R subunit
MGRTNKEKRSSWALQCYDPLEDRAVVWRRLPHWSQAGTVCFITWRTWDSMPASVIRAWHAERDAWLRQNGVDPSRPGWEALLGDWPAERLRKFQRYVSDRWSDHLDELHGACVLRRPQCARIVGDSLQRFDDDRYCLCGYVVMPNHVHVLAAFPTEEAMLAQCESWKHFTARQINGVLSKKGRFWEQDAFDHLVRSPEEFERLRCYIAENPRRARLQAGEYLHYWKD